jgi:hypothetical protein
LGWWLDKHQPAALLHGCPVFWPGTRLHFLLGSAVERLSDECPHSRQFAVGSSWRSTDDGGRAEQLLVDVTPFLGSTVEVAPIERIGDELNENIKKNIKTLCGQAEQIAKGLDALVSRGT